MISFNDCYYNMTILQSDMAILYVPYEDHSASKAYFKSVFIEHVMSQFYFLNQVT